MVGEHEKKSRSSSTSKTMLLKGGNLG